jgi:hypothetical protein
VTKFLISIPVSAPLPAPEDRIPTVPLQQSRSFGDVSAPAPAISIPPMDELIHLDFDTDEKALHEGRRSSDHVEGSE